MAPDASNEEQAEVRAFDAIFSLLATKDEDPRLISAMESTLRSVNAKKVLMMTGKDNLTLFQLAITSGATTGKVNLLLQHNPNLAKHRIRGRLPFYVALEACASEEVIRSLVDLYPQAVTKMDQEHLGLHAILLSKPFPSAFVGLAVKIVELWPHAAAVKCHKQLPLHMCLSNSLQPIVTLAVLKAHRSAAAVRFQDKLPLHIAVENNVDIRVISGLIEAYPGALLQRMPGADTHRVSLERHGTAQGPV